MLICPGRPDQQLAVCRVVQATFLHQRDDVGETGGGTVLLGLHGDDLGFELLLVRSARLAQLCAQRLQLLVRQLDLAGHRTGATFDQLVEIGAAGRSVGAQTLCAFRILVQIAQQNVQVRVLPGDPVLAGNQFRRIELRLVLPQRGDIGLERFDVGPQDLALGFQQLKRPLGQRRRVEIRLPQLFHQIRQIGQEATDVVFHVADLKRHRVALIALELAHLLEQRPPLLDEAVELFQQFALSGDQRILLGRRTCRRSRVGCGGRARRRSGGLGAGHTRRGDRGRDCCRERDRQKDSFRFREMVVHRVGSP